MKIGILTDNKNSWIMPYVDDLKARLKGHDIYHVFDSRDVQPGEVLFILSCEKILKSDVLEKNKRNIVVHPSKLPKGRGWSPVAWQVLEGSNKIPVSLFEAQESVDAGHVYILDYIELNGTELNDEIKHLQGIKTVEMCVRFINEYDSIEGTPQNGEPTFYKKRTAQSSCMDIKKSIEEQFDLLRVVDNDRYPAHFFIRGKKYIIKIERVYYDDKIK
jgi:methionyl-tRNA formyltransferase